MDKTNSPEETAARANGLKRWTRKPTQEELNSGIPPYVRIIEADSEDDLWDMSGGESKERHTPKNNSVVATWSIELNCTCPKCEHWVNLLDGPDFWDGRHLDIGENDTERSKNVEVVCPGCGHEFEVKCEY